MKIVSYLILFLRADDDLESFEVAENIEPNDFAPSDRAENIDFIDRPDSDLKEANEIVSPAMEPRILNRFSVIYRNATFALSALARRSNHQWVSLWKLWSYWPTSCMWSLISLFVNLFFHWICFRWTWMNKTCFILFLKLKNNVTSVSKSFSPLSKIVTAESQYSIRNRSNLFCCF